jgi:tetratricopeptide (TPR) repeat protein
MVCFKNQLPLIRERRLKVKCRFSQFLVIAACVILVTGYAATHKILVSEGALFKAASKGDTNTMETLSAGSPEANAENPMVKRSLVWAERREHRQIVELVKKAEAEQVEQTPRNADFYHNRGLTHARQLRFDEAIADYTKAIEINPKDDSAYIYRAMAYAEKSLYDKAVSDFTKAIEINPRDDSAYINRGSTYVNKGNTAKVTLSP